jgi:hypothetical protein
VLDSIPKRAINTESFNSVPVDILLEIRVDLIAVLAKSALMNVTNVDNESHVTMNVGFALQRMESKLDDLINYKNY